jgi:hypothetical protein
MVANPTAFNPVYHRAAAFARRDLVLQDMRDQHDITPAAYEHWRRWPLPRASDIQQPAEPAAAPYFTDWVAPQVLSAMGLGHGVSAKVAEFRAYYGGLKIHTTIDLEMQQAAQDAISEDLPSGAGEPTASLVSIDNRTGQVRAMVGGPLVDGRADYSRSPFNLAVDGLRQPGSAFKPFTLAVVVVALVGAPVVSPSVSVSTGVESSVGVLTVVWPWESAAASSALICIADSVYVRQISAGNVPPVTGVPWNSVSIGVSRLGKPTHTAVVNWGVQPTNQASASLLVVPVLPTTSTPGISAACPVPSWTTPSSSCPTAAATGAGITRR